MMLSDQCPSLGSTVDGALYHLLLYTVLWHGAGTCYVPMSALRVRIMGMKYLFCTCVYDCVHIVCPLVVIQNFEKRS